MASISIPKFRAALFPSPSGQRCFQLLLPDDDSFAQLVAGLYALATDADNWDGDDADREALAQAFLDAYTAMDWSSCLTSDWLITAQRIHPRTIYFQDGNAQAWFGNSSSEGAGYWAQSAPAINDALYWDVALKAGKYTIYVNYTKFAGSGKLRLYIDGTQHMDFDMYASATIVNEVAGVANISIADDGIHTLKTLVYGKHSSSTNYYFLNHYIDLIRTGDL